LVVPRLGLSSPLEALSLDKAGVLQPPTDYRQAGWYARGVVPGNLGPAVIAGHLDSVDGPAVFLRLAELRPGDLVLVGRSDGRTAAFRVSFTEQVTKGAFPTEQVYGPTPTPQLRLITCGGAFDHRLRRYPDDVVVFAERV
jgi:sortase (surface protein transpeptidase)